MPRPSAEKPPTIEDHFARIETVVGGLESGELPLDQALKQYEEGLAAVRAARAQLDAYQARIEELRVEPAP